MGRGGALMLESLPLCPISHKSETAGFAHQVHRSGDDDHGTSRTCFSFAAHLRSAKSRASATDPATNGRRAGSFPPPQAGPPPAWRAGCGWARKLLV